MAKRVSIDGDFNRTIDRLIAKAHRENAKERQSDGKKHVSRTSKKK